jgi:SHS family lactate transporter-like MFS transporter
MLEEQYGLSTNKANGIVAIGNVGACLGGMLVGYASEIAGRRLSIILSCIVGATLVYPYAYISGNGVYATSFFEQFCVQGAFGVVPIHLVELSPAPFRTFIVGTAYQMGVLFASPTNTIITVGGRHKSYDYSYVICIFSACIFVFVILVTAVGNERLGGDLVHGEWDHDESEVYQGGLTGLGMDNSNALAARMESETSKYQ